MEFRERGSGYFAIQSTRPQAIGYALTDSPAGFVALALRSLSTGAIRRSTEYTVNRNAILDEITLYWLTGTAASSARFYFEQVALLGKRNNPGWVELPVAVSLFPDDLPAPRSWADQVYPNLNYWNELDRGGHFASLEEPALFTQELRAFARALHRS